MSRCFPYPPPGYTPKRPGEAAALIESIKLQKETEKAQRKKDKKRDKKERRKDKKDNSEGLHKSDSQQLNGKVWQDVKEKIVEDETKLERSSLTEEYGLPVTLGAPSSSSDSTDNSTNKRKRPSLPDICPPAPGSKIIRIRLTSKKNNEAVSSVNDSQPCSTSGRETAPFTSVKEHGLDHGFKKEEIFHSSAVRSVVPQHLSSYRPKGELRISSSHHHTGAAAEASKSAAAPVLDSATRKKQKAYFKYKDLFDNWIPPALKDPVVDSDDDLDWLFQSRKQAEKSQKSVCETQPCSRTDPVSWPRAHYIPEIGVYALPYTVPL